MIEKIVNNILKYNLIKENSTILIGLSGGSDSVCLTEVLYRIKKNNLLNYDFNLKAVHINHMLRDDESNTDEQFVKEFCNLRNIDLIVYREDIKTLKAINKKSIEEVARDIRKERFNSLLTSSDDKIALGHNFSDNAETLLLHLFRGSGLNGLIGMDFLDNNYIRPLIKTKKEDILLFLETNNISYRTDSSNLEEVYSRNKVRLSLLPYLKENFNNNIISSLNNTIDILKSDNDFIEQNVTSTYNDCVKIEFYKKNKMVMLNIEKLKTLHPSILTRVFIKSFKEINETSVDFNSKNINDLKDLLSKETGKQIKLNKKIIAFKGYTEIYLFEEKIISSLKVETKYINIDTLTNVKDNIFINISNTKKEFNGYTCFKSKKFYFDKPRTFYIRSRQEDDKIYIEKINGHKNLKKYFIDEKVDSIFRDDIPLLISEDNLIMILDKKCISTDNFISGNISYYIQLFLEDGGLL